MLSLEASQKDNPVRSAIKKRRSVPLDRAINSVSGLYPHSATRLRISANAGKNDENQPRLEICSTFDTSPSC